MKKQKIIIIALIAIIAVAVVIGVILSLEQNKHEHAWGEWQILSEANCFSTGEEIRTCNECGSTESKIIPITHTWMPATCLNPKECELCHTTEGEALGHNFMVATCRRPKTCIYCYYAEGTTEPHNYVDGKCTECSEWMKLNITVTDVPLTIEANYGQILKFTDLHYGWHFNSNTSFDLYLYYDAEKMFDDSGENKCINCWFRYKVLDSDGYIVNSGSYCTTDMCVGDKVKDQYVCVAYRLDPKKSYTIVVTDY